MKTEATSLICITAMLVSCTPGERQSQRASSAPHKTQYRLQDYAQDANGLSCAIALTEDSKKNGNFAFVLKNVSGNPIRICGFCPSWQGRSPDIISVILDPEFWGSDRPTDDQIRQSIITIEPGDSFSIPVNIGADSRGIPVEVGYGVRIQFGKRFGTWHGEIAVTSGPIVE
jgi:hypothetical protein